MASRSLRAAGRSGANRPRRGLALGALIVIGLSYIAGNGLCASVTPYGGGGGVVFLIVPLVAALLTAAATWPWSRVFAPLAALATLAAAGWLFVLGVESGGCQVALGSEDVKFSACGAIGDVEPAWTKQNVVFLRCGTGGRSKVMAVASTGGEPRDAPLPARVRPHVGASDELAVGPGGGLVLSNEQLWLVDGTERSAVRIRDSVGADSPAWSADGTQIAFGVPSASDADPLFGASYDDVVVLDLRTNSFRTIAPGAMLREADPTWSPDGRWLAIETEGTDIAIVRSNGREKPRVIVRGGHDPAWSPRGGELVFTDLLFRLVVIDPLSDAPPDVVLADAYPSDPAWSPDGSEIVFSRHDRDPAELWLIRRDGSGLRRLTDGG